MVLDGKRTESRNLGFWTEKRNPQFWTEFGWKKQENGQLIAKKIVRIFRIHWLCHNASAVRLRKQMPRTIAMKMEYFSFTKRVT